MTPSRPGAWLLELQRSYRDHVGPGERLLLAISGGLDSTALLVGTARLAGALGVSVEVGTIDHGLRSDSRRDCDRVLALAKAWGLPGHLRAVDVGHRGNLEANARRVRYQALETLAREIRADWIVTAHSASDQAETLLMRLLRGSATRGAGGIHPRRGRILRPMLGLTRAQNEQFLREQSLDWARDPMNDDPRFLRTRIRRELMPLVESLAGEGAARRLARFAQLLQADEAYLEEEARRAFERLQLADGALDAAGVRALAPPLAGRVLRRLGEQAGLALDAELIAASMAALARGRPCGWPEGRKLKPEGGLLRLVGAPADPPTPALLEEAPVRFGDWEVARSRSAPRPSLGWTGLPMDCQRPLVLRGRRPGDRVRWRRASRTVQDVMVDAGVPQEARQRWPILCDGQTGEPLWVVGLWPRVRPGTSEAGWVVAQCISPKRGARPGHPL